MSIQSEINRLSEAKAAICSAIEGKGVSVPTGTTLSAVAPLIASIPSGSADLIDLEEVIAKNYTNQIPISVDASGAVFNGIGYKTGFALNSSGEEIANDRTCVSGFIPVKKGDIIRVKDTTQDSFDTTVAFVLYKSDQATGSNIGRTISDIQKNTSYGSVTIENNLLTWDTSGIGYWFWNDFAFLRVTVHSADAELTVNEEIVETVSQKTVLKTSIKVKRENLEFPVGFQPLEGKSVVCFGDSLFGLCRDSTSAPAVLAKTTGATVYNVGFGGCTMSQHPTSGYREFSMYALADAIASNDWSEQDAAAASGQDYFPSQLETLKSIDFSQVDIAVIHYGTNDFGGGVAIGQSDGPEVTTSLCGALRHSIETLLGAYPKLRLYISVPCFRYWESDGIVTYSDTYQNSQNNTLPEVVAAMKAVAQEYNLPVIDSYYGLGINKVNAAAFLGDETHHNADGRERFGRFVGAGIVAEM